MKIWVYILLAILIVIAFVNEYQLQKYGIWKVKK